VDTPVDVSVDVGGYTGGGRWMSVETGGTLAESVDSAKMLVETGGDAGRADDDR